MDRNTNLLAGKNSAFTNSDLCHWDRDREIQKNRFLLVPALSKRVWGSNKLKYTELSSPYHDLEKRKNDLGQAAVSFENWVAW